MSAAEVSEQASLVRSMWGSIGDRDLDAFLACFTEDAELHSVWSTFEGVGPYKGRAGLERWWNTALLEAVETFEGSVEQAISVDDIVLALVRVEGTGKSGGLPFSRLVGQLFRLEDGRISRLSAHLHPADAFNEAATALTEDHPDA